MMAAAPSASLIAPWQRDCSVVDDPHITKGRATQTNLSRQRVSILAPANQDRRKDLYSVRWKGPADFQWLDCVAR